MNVICHLSHHVRKKDGTAAVYLFVHIGKKIRFETGISVLPEEWDYENKRVRGSHADDYNMIINNCKARINDIFVKYRLMNKPVTPNILKKEYMTVGITGDFIRFIEDVKLKQKGSMADATEKTYVTLIYKLKRFRDQISFNEIDSDFILDFKRHHKKSPISGLFYFTMGLLRYFCCQVKVVNFLRCVC
jgi:integrase/recombinase XerD